MNRKANAEWKGNLKEGKGIVSTSSKFLENLSYTFHSRFENAVGTNPEELIAAAHAACFSMKLSGELEKEGIKPESIQTECSISMENGVIQSSALKTKVIANGASKEAIQKCANSAKENCPVSKALNLQITLQLD